MTYLSRTELEHILKNDYFSTFLTVSEDTYAFYRGRLNAFALTIRFNIHSENFSEQSMINALFNLAGRKFKPNKTISAVIAYDIVLVNNENPAAPSYYIWRANSNQRVTIGQDEIQFNMSNDNLLFLARKALQFNVNDLEINFTSSKCQIYSVHSIVFTLVNV